MPGLVPGIHVYGAESKTWMAGTSPAMTTFDSALVEIPLKQMHRVRRENADRRESDAERGERDRAP